MASAYDIWGLIASVFGLLSIFQILEAIINAQLPISRIRKFDHLREETDQLLQSVVEDFQDEGQYIENKARIAKVCNRLEALRVQAFTARTYKDELRQWWSGLSSRISVCCEDLKSLRAHISTTSSKAREALARHQAEQPVVSATDPASDVDADVNTDDLMMATLEAPTEEGRPSPDADDKDDEASFTAALDSVQQLEYISKGGNDSPALIPPIAVQGAGAVVSTQSDSTHILPSHRQNTIPPQYPSSSSPPPGGNIVRTATVLARYTSNPSHSARINHKLVQAYRRNLMLHNVPWKDECTRGQDGLRSAATSCRNLGRPSLSPKAWNALRKTRGVLSMYVTMLSSDEPVLPTSAVDATAT